MRIDEARQLAAQAWCHPRTKNLVLDVNLAETFAEILVQQTEKAVVAELIRKRLYGKNSIWGDNYD